LRLWVASTDYSGEISISDEILKRVVESYRRIRNTLRFLLANLADFDFGKDAVPMEQWLEIDRYLLAHVRQFQDQVAGDYERNEFHQAMQKLHHFCSEDLGGFYLDILKDRLYIGAAGGVPRRAAQTMLHHIAHSLVRLFAPVLSFTSEEVWATLTGDAADSVLLHTWYPLPKPVPAQADEAPLILRWQALREIRSRVQKVLEEARVKGEIGSSLAAEVTIHAGGDEFALLDALGDDLRLLLVTSKARVVHMDKGENGAALRVAVVASPHVKCERCWHYRADVGGDAAHATICGRCVSNLFGAGEERRYA